MSVEVIKSKRYRRRHAAQTLVLKILSQPYPRAVTKAAAEQLKLRSTGKRAEAGLKLTAGQESAGAAAQR